MKLLLAASLALCTPALAWAPEHVSASPDTIKSVRWEGQTDIDMLKQVRADIESASDGKIKTLKVALVSPGGPVITSLEIARLIRDTTERTGLVIEIHAEALCASGCTFVLASGTPQHRFISKWALFLVHPPQGGGFGEASCISHVDNPKTQQDKITDVLFDLMRDHYVRYTGASPAEVEEWLTCGNEQVGSGELAVRLNMADATE